MPSKSNAAAEIIGSDEEVQALLDAIVVSGPVAFELEVAGVVRGVDVANAMDVTVKAPMVDRVQYNGAAHIKGRVERVVRVPAPIAGVIKSTNWARWRMCSLWPGKNGCREGAEHGELSVGSHGWHGLRTLPRAVSLF